MKICTVIGARPQFIKAAVVSRAIREYNESLTNHQSPITIHQSPITEVIIHTGQHYDYEMSQVFFDQLDIPKPDYHLEINMVNGKRLKVNGSDHSPFTTHQSPLTLHGDQTGKMLSGIENILIKEKPDWVLVYGDTNSTLAGALAASKLHIKIAHVEAGLRSYNRMMPEEINRVVTDHLSTILFAPTPTAVANLGKEGVVKGVHFVPDVMEEALFTSLPVAEEKSMILEKLGLAVKGSNQSPITIRESPITNHQSPIAIRPYALSTIHRAENTDDLGRLKEILSALTKITEEMPVVLPLHPRTKKIIEKEGLQSQITNHQSPITNHQSLIVIDPVSYIDMLKLESNAKVILTDSGGVQKEAMWLKVPCITMRDETEWVETVEDGWNIVTGHNLDRILDAYQRVLQNTCETNGLGNGSPRREAGKTMLNILGSL